MKFRVTGQAVNVLCAWDCPLCPMCEEPVCPRCDEHWADCDCPGPMSEPEDGWLVVVENGATVAYPIVEDEDGSELQDLP